jgi:hypothetical protein
MHFHIYTLKIYNTQLTLIFYFSETRKTVNFALSFLLLPSVNNIQNIIHTQLLQLKPAMMERGRHQYSKYPAGSAVHPWSK